jgi:hypothetical protein
MPCHATPPSVGEVRRTVQMIRNRHGLEYCPYHDPVPIKSSCTETPQNLTALSVLFDLWWVEKRQCQRPALHVLRRSNHFPGRRPGARPGSSTSGPWQQRGIQWRRGTHTRCVPKLPGVLFPGLTCRELMVPDADPAGQTVPRDRVY